MIDIYIMKKQKLLESFNHFPDKLFLIPKRAMVQGRLSVPGRPTIWIRVGQGPTSLAMGWGGGCLDFFTLVYYFSFLSPSI